MTTTTELKKLLFSMILKTPIWLVHLAANQSSVMSIPTYVRTATRTTLKVEANLTQILNFKANFHTEFESFFKKKIYANNGGHFKIVSIKIKN